MGIVVMVDFVCFSSGVLVGVRNGDGRERERE